MADVSFGGNLDGREVQTALVKVPFAFAVGNQILPAGLYQIEMLTHAKPGPDAIEVIAIRGQDNGHYASAVALLELAETNTLRLTFLQGSQGAVLTGIELGRKNLRLATGFQSQEAIENAKLSRTITLNQEGMEQQP